MYILIFNESEGNLTIILQTSWGTREALGWGEEGGQSDKQRERGRGRMKMEGGHRSGCRGVDGRGTPGPMYHLPQPDCLPHCTDREESRGNLAVTPKVGER